MIWVFGVHSVVSVAVEPALASVDHLAVAAGRGFGDKALDFSFGNAGSFGGTATAGQGPTTGLPPHRSA
jgi:hypothetical protein